MAVALRKSRILLVALLLLFGVAGTMMVNAGKASAATCYGDYCSGVDPDASGCSADAITTTVYNDPHAVLQVRWSPSCQTNWARLVVYPTGIACFREGLLQAIQDTGYTQAKYTDAVCDTYSDTTFYTNMIYSPVHHVRGSFQDGSAFSTPVYTPWS